MSSKHTPGPRAGVYRGRAWTTYADVNVSGAPLRVFLEEYPGSPFSKDLGLCEHENPDPLALVRAWVAREGK